MSFANQFLVAMPSLGSDGFGGKVIAMMHHGSDGAMGLIVNEPSMTSVADVLRQLGAEPKPEFEDITVYVGGPVEPNKGFMLYEGEQQAASMPVCGSLWLTSDRDTLLNINQSPPQRFMLFAGYAGWDDQQLEQEMADNAWLNLPVDIEKIFDDNDANKLMAITAANGIDYSRMSSAHGHA
ncbi:MAG: YqgE/AlgH family protein [Gammaproteobacteria bacterium]|nr:YqgE/AlgH family protein [Gammaproteobacteria bacterium]